MEHEKTLQKERSHTHTLLITVAILVIVGIIYHPEITAGNVFAQNIQAGATQPILSPSLSLSRQTGKIILLVDDMLLGGLGNELKTYSQDIKRELGLNTVIRPVTKSDTVLTLKNYVANFYKQNGLSGVMIVGDVPTGQMYNSTVASGTVFDSEGYILADSIYQDVFDACIYSPAKNAFDYKNPECQTGNTVSLYWVARLTPNSTATSSLTLLKNYFQRNHAFRTGKISFKNNLLSYLPITNESQSSVSDLKAFTDRIPGYGTYNTSQSVLIDANDPNSDRKFLTELSKSNNYEAVIYNGHGAPTFSMKDIKSSNLVSTKFIFLDLLSCSVGRFTTPDYLAGQYLFSGGLIEVSASTPVFAATQYAADVYEMLSLGIPFYKAFEYGGFGDNILGDPTLKMRYNNYTKSGSKMIVPTKELSFSKIHPDQTITIKNAGTKPLLFAVKGKPFQQKNSSFITSFGVVFDSNAISTNDKPLTLLPGKTTKVSFQTKYYFPYDTIPAGAYKEKFYIMSNDPTNPLVEIVLNYSVLNGGNEISTPPLRPIIVVASPSSGVINAIKGDGTYNIQWTTQNWNGLPLNIDLLGDDGVTRSITTNTPNTGRYVWRLDTTIPTGNYKLHIYTGQNTLNLSGKGDLRSDESISNSFTYYP